MYKGIYLFILFLHLDNVFVCFNSYCKKLIMSPLLDNFRLNTVFIVSLQRKVTKQIQGKILAN